MPALPTIRFAPFELPSSGALVVLVGEGVALGENGRQVEAASGGLIAAAAEAQAYKGKRLAALVLAMPRNLSAQSLVLVGLGDAEKLPAADWAKVGGTVTGSLPGGPNRDVTVVAETPNAPLSADQAADLALGIVLRAYDFDRYKTKKGDEPDPAPRAVTIAVADVAAAEARWAAVEAAVEGTVLARDLVNEPANVLGPLEFAARAGELAALGVAIRVLEPEELATLEFRALLGVAQGSARPARVVAMEWKGGSAESPPVALVGKGVVFDSGGISIKPAAGMEDMKGDMAGAAAVVGTLHALAKRQARANVVGVIGIVENMPDGNAQRPGDVVISKSGQSIEIINTDAEGRLVLADCITWTLSEYKPRVLIDLCTLTGAIIVALGQYQAGLYSEDDTLAAQLADAGKATGDLVWRMPLGKDYDSMIDSKIADMKNTGGRYAGSVTGAQFVKRFVQDSTWAHIDLAGTAMAAPANEISRTFGSGWGVRLLDRFVADFYEDGADSRPHGPSA